MNSLQIQYFMEVVRQESFTHASRILYISQPSISRQIANLEAELGTALFDRTKSKAKLTDAGRMYYNLFENFTMQMEETALEISRMDNSMKGNLKIGFVEGWDINQIADSILEKFVSQHDSFDLDFRTYNFKELLANLQANELDGIICPTVLVEAVKNVQYVNLPELRNVMIYSAKHASPLNGESYEAEDFVNQRLFVLSKDETPVAREYCRNYFHSKGYELDIEEMPNRDSMLFEVSLDRGYAIFDVWTRAIHSETLKYYKLDIAMPICFAWKRKSGNPWIEVFANEINFHVTQEKERKIANRKKAADI